MTHTNSVKALKNRRAMKMDRTVGEGLRFGGWQRLMKFEGMCFMYLILVDTLSIFIALLSKHSVPL